jgi:hypothetical protein
MKHIVAGVSGGVWAASEEVLSKPSEREAAIEINATPTTMQWWWDL